MRGYLKHSFGVLAALLLCLPEPSYALPPISKKVQICAAVLGILAVPVAAKWGPRFIVQGTTFIENRAPWNPDWKGQRTIHGGTLTPFWAQELIGVDLRPRSAKLESSPRPVNIATWSGAYDPKLLPQKRLNGDIDAIFRSIPADRIPTGMKEHGTGIVNLILGDSPVGISKAAQLKVALSDGAFYSHPKGRSIHVLADSQIELIHLSIAGLPREPIEFLNHLVEEKHKVIVAGAGNLNEEQKVNASTSTNASNLQTEQIENASYQLNHLNAIVVGSLDPDGQVSPYSSPSSQVFILAPSGDYLQTITKEKYIGGVYSTLGKTSGASALVAGTVTDLLSLIPSLTQDEVKIILRNTALPTQNLSKKRGLQGYGMLNDCKVFYVADRILKENNFDSWDPLERKVFLENPDLYNYGVTAAQFFADGSKNLESSDPEVWMQGLDQMRTAFHLTPLAQYADALSKAYRSKGLISNARYYESIPFKVRDLDIEEAEAKKAEALKPVATSTRR